MFLLHRFTSGERFLHVVEVSKKVTLLFTLLLFPIIFLPGIESPLLQGKVYFLLGLSLLLLCLCFLEFCISKKVLYEKRALDLPLFLLSLYVGVLTLTSHNATSAIFNPSFGLISIFALFTLYINLSRSNIFTPYFVSMSGLAIAVLNVIFIFQPLKNLPLPFFLDFLTSPRLTLTGNYFESTTYLLIALVAAIIVRINLINSKEKKSSLMVSGMNSLTILILSLGLLMSFFLYIRLNGSGDATLNIFAPGYLSWLAGIELFKNPLALLFGSGIGGFAENFPKVRDVYFNLGSYWETTTYQMSRSLLTQSFVETGIIGFGIFSFVLFRAYKIAKKVLTKKTQIVFILTTITIVVFFAPTILSIYILAITLAYVGQKEQVHEKVVINLKPFFSLVLASFCLFLCLSFGVIFWSLQIYRSEYLLQLSLFDSNSANIYAYQKQSLILNSSSEDIRREFSRTNLAIAKAVAAKKPLDERTLRKSVEDARLLADSAVGLNPHNVLNVVNLASIYEGLSPFVKNASDWAIASYIDLIKKDSNNPRNRFNLGRLYFSLGQFENAEELFKQTAELKPNWTNAYYNLAWTQFKLENYQSAVETMKKVTSTIASKDDPDYELAQKDLKEFERYAESKNKPQVQNPSPTVSIFPSIQLPTLGASPSSRLSTPIQTTSPSGTLNIASPSAL